MVQRATVMGLGTRGGGLGVTRYLVEQGMLVTVTDRRTETELAESMAVLAGLPIRYVLGRHDERDFLPEGADLIVRNPGVRRDAPLLSLARQHGLPIEMEMSLFLRACPAPVIGVTGTKGKTSTATLCGAMLTAWDPATVVAGNMGGSALARLPEIGPTTPVVLELSSWQLEALIEHRLAPRIAVLTNISEDHLDHYDGFADYAATKRGITRYQTPDDVLIVNADDPEAWRAAGDTRARVVPFGLAESGRDGAWFDGSRLIWRWRQGTDERSWDLPMSPAFAGTHGAANALAALAAATLRGATEAAVATALQEFGGVRDRMETVAEIAGVLYINDTTATAPAAVVAGMQSLAGKRVHLIAGGADKRTDLAPLADVARAAAAVYLLDGSATPTLAALLTERGIAPIGPFFSIDAAVGAAADAARPGEVVVLSPGCASFGMFRDEFDRGARFRAAVGRIASGVESAVPA